MRLFVDDTRKFPERGYECCRYVKDAKLLLSIIEFDHISLDYSLFGDETCMEILEYMKENDIFVPHINIHSNNIIGKERMKKFCEEHFPKTKLTMIELPK